MIKSNYLCLCLWLHFDYFRQYFGGLLALLSGNTGTNVFKGYLGKYEALTQSSSDISGI